MKQILTKKEQQELLGGIVGSYSCMSGVISSAGKINNNNYDDGCSCTYTTQVKVRNRNDSNGSCICLCV